MGGEQFGEYPIEVPAQYIGSPSLVDCLLDLLRTYNLQSKERKLFEVISRFNSVILSRQISPGIIFVKLFILQMRIFTRRKRKCFPLRKGMYI